MITRLDTDLGRYYQTPDGIFPSVTTVLGSIPNPDLDAWREAVGKEQADLISKKATTKGTAMHSFCEAYLKKESIKMDALTRYTYGAMIPHLDKIEPLYIEEQLWSKKLRVAGTLDCLGKYQGTLSIIDFKSTSNLKYDGDFDSYWLQTAAYAVMAYERFGLIINDLVIIMQDLAANDCYVFKQKANSWIPRFREIRDAFEDTYF